MGVQKNQINIIVKTVIISSFLKINKTSKEEYIRGEIVTARHDKVYTCDPSHACFKYGVPSDRTPFTARPVVYIFCLFQINLNKKN